MFFPAGAEKERGELALPEAYRRSVLTLDGLILRILLILPILLILLILLDSLQVFSYTGQHKLNTVPYLLGKSI